jgi:hypothetical protein
MQKYSTVRLITKEFGMGAATLIDIQNAGLNRSPNLVER